MATELSISNILNKKSILFNYKMDERYFSPTETTPRRKARRIKSPVETRSRQEKPITISSGTSPAQQIKHRRIQTDRSLQMAVDGNYVAMTASGDKKSAEIVAGMIEASVQSNTQDDKQCDPDIKTCYQAKANIKKINSKLGQMYIEEESRIFDDVSTKTQEIYRLLEHYNMSPLFVESYFKHFRGFCHTLKMYNEKLASKKNLTQKDVNKYFISVKFAHALVVEDYKNTMMFLEQRVNFEAKPAERSWWSYAWTILKWMWNYKYILYISGLFLYNLKLFILPEPITTGFNLMINLVGTICYTFASDRASMGTLLEFISSVFIIVLYGLYKAAGTIPGIGAIQYIISSMGRQIPSAIRKLFQVGRSVVFYFFLIWAIDWISYATKLVCQGVLIFGSAVNAGERAYYEVWTIFETGLTQIGQSISSAFSFIFEFVSKSGVQIASFMSKIFIETIYKDIILPAGQYVENLPNKIWEGVKGMFWGGRATGPISQGLRQLPDGAIHENAQRALVIIQKNALASIENQTAEQLEKTVATFRENFVVVAQSKIDETISTIGQISNQTLEQTQQKVDKIFKQVRIDSGSDRLWKALTSLKFRSAITPYVVGILFVFSILAIFSGVV